MTKKLDTLDHKYNGTLATIRESNAERHAGYENTLKLRQNIQRFQRNVTYDMELQRLRGAKHTLPLTRISESQISKICEVSK